MSIIKQDIFEVNQNDKNEKILVKHLVDLMTKLDVNVNIEFTINNNKITLNCIKKEKNGFFFTVINDTSNKLKNLKNLGLNLKSDELNDTESNIYKLNRNIISTSDNGKTYNLKFIGFTQDNKKIPVDFKNITSVNKKYGVNDGVNDGSDVTLQDGKEALKIIMNNPRLKDAFYKAPSLWQLFKSELTGEKPEGTGILTVLDILDKYDNFEKEKIEDYFIDGKQVTIKFLDDYNIVFDKDKQIKFYKDDEYVYKVVKGKKEQKIILYGVHDNQKYYIPIYGSHGDRFYTRIKNTKYFFSIVKNKEKSPGFTQS
jgi:hypothetical protein